MPLSPEQTAHLNRQARRRAERAAEEMSFGKVNSEDYLRRLRAKRRPGRPFEIEEIPAAVEIEDDDDLIPPYESHDHPNARRASAPPREATSPLPRRGPNLPRAPTNSRAKPTSNAKPATKTSTANPRASFKEMPKSRHDLLHVAQHPSTSTLGSKRLSFASVSSAWPSRSTLSLTTPNRSVRRAKSVAVTPPTPSSVENESARATQLKHVPSKSNPTAMSSGAPVARGSLSKRSSLRSIKDKIRRVASAFELRSANDETNTNGDITLQHNNSTRSLLRYSATRIRRRRLDTVNEEA